MSRLRVFSARTESSTEIVLELSGKAKKGSLNSGYFSVSSGSGLDLQVASASLQGKKAVLLEVSEAIDEFELLSVSYNPPKGNQKSGVIQDKKGKDAKAFQVNIEQEPAIDPLTNAWTYEGHTYQLIKSAKNWSDAVADSLTRGGYLVEADTLAENQDLFDRLRGLLSQAEFDQTRSGLEEGGGAAYVWLGGSDIETEGTWIWAKSGKSITLNTPPWGSGQFGREPDNLGFLGDTTQDGLALGLNDWPYLPGDTFNGALGSAGQWNDQNVTAKYFYVVEYDQILPIA